MPKEHEHEGQKSCLSQMHPPASFASATILRSLSYLNGLSDFRDGVAGKASVPTRLECTSITCWKQFRLHK
jgi:hypothetical protein